MTKKKIIPEKVNELLKEQVAKQGNPFFTWSEIENLCHRSKYRINKTSVIPSDYCYNKTNCGIDKKGFDIDKRFLKDRRDRNEYEYLGKGYPYTGSIYHKKQEVGELKNGKLIWFSGPNCES